MSGLIRRFFLGIKFTAHVLIGAIDFFRLLKRKDATHYIILPWYLGDSLFALAYLGEYRTLHNYGHITIVTCQYQRELCSFYSNEFNEILYMEKSNIRDMQSFARTIWGQSLTSKKYRDSITFAHYTCQLFRRVVKYNQYLTLENYTKYLLYQIGPDAKIQAPCIPQIDVAPFAQKYGIIKNRTVLLNPYANTVKCDVTELFTQLGKILKDRGYIVATLTVKDQEPIPDTIAIPCSLSEAFRLAEHCGTVVALRSGFLDLMQFAACRIAAIIDVDSEEKSFSDLEKSGINRNYHTFEYSGDNDDAIHKILNTFCME